ncbi:MAG: glycosyltransferase family 2 protein [Peptococcaceae bacterium]|nr:glycosyltransferase family 2 protein [Peptococcaceae bacterium]
METYTSVIQQVFNVTLISAQLLIVAVTLYYFTLAFIGIRRKPEKKDYAPVNRFAVTIAAHNEEQVIAQLVENLRNMDYPQELFDIYVVADNCSDKTAILARKAGAIVFQRYNDKKRGKGYALEWLFAKIASLKKDYDAVVIFDADNLVKKNFLLEMNNKLCDGEKIVQGYIDSKNPYDTWVTNTFSIAFWLMNRMIQLARFNLGISNVLAGTGMCISTDVLKKVGWGAHSLTEDLEFTMKALMYGIKTSWAHDAVVYDEKPLTFMQSFHQRKRWAQGQIDVAGRYLVLLIVKGLREKKWMYFDAALHLFQPFFTMIATGFLLIQLLTFLQPYYTNIFIEFIPWSVWQVVSGIITIFPLIALFLDRIPWRAYLGLILFPIFMYSWIPIIFVGFLHRNRKEWSHTKHTRSISYEEIMEEKSS